MDLDALEVNYHAMLLQSPDPIALLDVDSGLLADLNPAAEALWGLPRARLLGMGLDALCPALQPGGMASAELLRGQVARALDGASALFRVVFRRADGSEACCDAVMLRLAVSGRRLIHARILDVSDRIGDARLRDGQGEVLELIAREAPLKQILDRLLRLIEGQSPGVLCSVLLLDEDGVSIRPASAPSLPPAFMDSLDGLHIGPTVGSCGDAMFENKTVVVPDIYADPRWTPYLSLAAPYGLRACWSVPISPDGVHVLGSFAMYHSTVRSPTEADMRLTEVATHLAGIAIQRARRERELRLHREHLEDLVAARTADLTAAMDRADQINRDLSNALSTLSLAQDELVRRDKLAALGAWWSASPELNTPIGNSLMVATSFRRPHRRAVPGRGSAALP
jgi:PAS domain S-box-containing protein